MGCSESLEKIFAGRWIAGARVEDAVREAQKFNRIGVKAIINYLGEEFQREEDAEEAIAKIKEAIHAIKSGGVNADISVKPTQLGLLVSEQLFASNLKMILREAKKFGIFVWIDMEEPETVGKVVHLYSKEFSYNGVGICIQSYLKRSSGDLRLLARQKAVIRLVKGAYSLTSAMYSTREEINSNYLKLMEYLFKHFSKFTIATHDLAIIEKALKLNSRYKREVTYAMLKGVRNRYLKELAAKGESVSVYIPFGDKWISYSYRRLREAGHLSLIIKSLFERQGV
ncbi:MAG: proline dehydrogenase family protein [Candidatus Micrarchaeia archaeon]